MSLNRRVCGESLFALKDNRGHIRAPRPPVSLLEDRSLSSPSIIRNAHEILYALDGKGDALEQGFLVRFPVERQDENLLLVYLLGPLIGVGGLMAGPPVEKEKVFWPSSFAPARVLTSGFNWNSQRTPASRFFSKSYTQFLVSAHRPSPFTGQFTAKA